MILAALEVEVEEYRQQHRDARDPRGHALVVRNGQARPRRLTVGAGTVTIAAPRVNDQRGLHGARQKFTSAILPPSVRRSGTASAVLPLLSLQGSVHRGLPGGPAGAVGERRGGALACGDHPPDGHLADRV